MRSQTLTSVPREPATGSRAVSEPLKPASRFERLLLSWNVGSTSGGPIALRVQVKAEGLRWSSWFDAGTWPPRRYAPKTRDPLYGRMLIDELRLRRPCVAARYQVLRKKGAALPRTVFLTCSPALREPDSEPPPESGPLSVPYFSQFSPDDLPDEAVREAGGCGPTSMAMVAAYFGVDTRPLDVAGLCYDPQHNIYGNWAYLASGASTFGLEAWVARASGWAEVADWVSDGAVPVLSLAWEEGQLPGAPVRRSSGHLLVVAGTGPSGIVCYDPAAGRGPVTYPWREFGNIFWGHGGVAIVVRRP
jgi:hypothetical protein